MGMIRELLNNQGLLALLGALFGGIGLKGLESWLNRSKDRVDKAAQFRDEQREEIVRLRAEMHQIEESEERWRTKYYEVMDLVTKFKTLYAEAASLLRQHGIDPPVDRDE